MMEEFLFENQNSNLVKDILDDPKIKKRKSTEESESASEEISENKKINNENTGKQEKKKSVKTKKSKKHLNNKEKKIKTVNKKKLEKKKIFKINQIKKRKLFSYHFKKKSRIKCKKKLKLDNYSGNTTQSSSKDLYFGNSCRKKGYYCDNIKDAYFPKEEETDFCNFEALTEISLNNDYDA